MSQGPYMHILVSWHTISCEDKNGPQDGICALNMHFKVIRLLLAFTLLQYANADTLKVGVAPDLVTFRDFSMGKVE